MGASFESILLRAVSLLKELPHGRGDMETARRRVNLFRTAHPGVRADLLVDQPPASAYADYDLMLEHPDGGSVVLSWQPDGGTPWSVAYADHWAANYVASVNQRDVTIQEALLFLQLAFDQYPDLMAEVVDQALIAQAIEEHPEAVDDTELQAAADEFRNTHGLCRADDTHRWLQERGLSVERLEELLVRLIRRRKLEAQVADGPTHTYFEDHPRDFDTVRFFRVTTVSKAVAARLAEAARKNGLVHATHLLLPGLVDGDLTVSLKSQYAIHLPADIASADAGVVVGPVAEGDVFWVAQILHRQPARLDVQSRAVIRERLIREWLADRRRNATVRWHWI